MFIKFLNILFFVLISSALLITTKTCFAIDNSGAIEYSNSINTATFHSIKTISLLTRGQPSRGDIVYAGLRYSSYELSDQSDSSGIFHVLMGATMRGTFAPFMEIGTDILGLFLLDEELDEESVCGNEQCDIDKFLKAGIRIQLQNGLSLGVFHEWISFDDHRIRLVGNHNYTGMSLGYAF